MSKGDRRARPPLPALLGRPLEPLYRAELRRRNRRFDRGVGVERAAVPVVSVGNLSVGGTGKSPMVAWVVERLLDLGRRPGIALRGYRAAGGESDEAREHAERHPRVPVAVDPVRGAAVRRLATDHGVDVAVLDDGFQHRRLHRDLDIVLLDASRSPFADRCLPAGWLREPVASLDRAGALVVTHAEAAPDEACASLAATLRARWPNRPVAICRHVWRRWRVADRSVGIDELAGARVAGVCGIGNPDPFLAELRRRCDVAATWILPDHHPWRERDLPRLRRLLADADRLVTTEKDWVKLRRLLPRDEHERVARPVLALGFDAGGPALATALAEAVLR